MESITHTHAPRRSYPISAERLRDARERASLTQEALAERVGASRRSYIGWEQGHHSPNPRFVRALSDELGVTVPWLRDLN